MIWRKSLLGSGRNEALTAEFVFEALMNRHVKADSNGSQSRDEAGGDGELQWSYPLDQRTSMEMRMLNTTGASTYGKWASVPSTRTDHGSSIETVDRMNTGE